MKKLGFIALMFIAILLTSCGKDANVEQSQIYGRWMSTDGTYFEVYYSDGTGKCWDTKDDVSEDEASVFTWEFDDEAENKFFQYHQMESGGIVPQYCNILELTSSNFKYNNEGFRATYNLIRAN